MQHCVLEDTLSNRTRYLNCFAAYAVFACTWPLEMQSSRGLSSLRLNKIILIRWPSLRRARYLNCFAAHAVFACTWLAFGNVEQTRSVQPSLNKMVLIRWPSLPCNIQCKPRRHFAFANSTSDSKP